MELILSTEKRVRGVGYDMKGKINGLKRNENVRDLYADMDKKRSGIFKL